MAFWTKNPSELEANISNPNGTSTSPKLPEGKNPLVLEGKADRSVSDRSVTDRGVEAARAQTTSSASPASGAYRVGAEAADLVDSKMDRFGKVRSALGAGTVIQGKLSFDTPVRIDGKLSGEVFSTDALIVGPTGLIDAQIEASHLIVMGTVRGVVKATKKIELLAGGRIESDVTTPTLSVEEGSVFHGKCSMNSTAAVVGIESTAQKAVSQKVEAKKPEERTPSTDRVSDKNVPTAAAAAITGSVPATPGVQH